MYSPWGKIEHVTKHLIGVSFVSTSSHGGFRVTLNQLKEYACDHDFLLKYAAIVENDYAYFEEDCAAQLFLFDCPRILKIVAANLGRDENEMFEDCKQSVERWYPMYFQNDNECPIQDNNCQHV